VSTKAIRCVLETALVCWCGIHCKLFPINMVAPACFMIGMPAHAMISKTIVKAFA